jgi:hypothetical protein
VETMAIYAPAKNLSPTFWRLLRYMPSQAHTQNRLLADIKTFGFPGRYDRNGNASKLLRTACEQPTQSAVKERLLTRFILVADAGLLTFGQRGTTCHAGRVEPPGTPTYGPLRVGQIGRATPHREHEILGQQRS